MRAANITILNILLTLVLFSCHDGRRHEATLQWADSLNRNYINIPSDSQLVEAVAYYDRHGTPNERMRAHYLLGCSYRDMGEAPKALACYHDAADCADTLSSDCDYELLSKVYGQISMLFYERYLHKAMIRPLQLAIGAAQKGNNIALVANHFESLGSAYEQSGDMDKAIDAYKKAVQNFKKAGLPTDAYISTGMLASAYVSAGQLSDADSCMRVYEQHSGLFQPDGSIVAGKEVYYYVKGLYFLKKGDTANAESYFRKELCKAATQDDSLSAYDGLRQLYDTVSNNDSVAKYSSLCLNNVVTQFSDSSIQQMENIQAQYDYRHTQQKAKEIFKDNTLLRSTILGIVSVCILLAIVVALYLVNIKRRQSQLIRELEKFANNGEDSPKAEGHDGEVRGVPTMNATLHSHILHAIKNPVKCKLSDEDWGQLEQFFDDRLPHFRHHLNSNGQILRQEEYRICMLVYIKCQPHDICSLMNMSSAHVSNTRKRILFKVYGIDGKPKDLDDRIRRIC